MTDKKDSTRSPRYTNGPVVKTGPTAGQNRSRTKSGTWTKKRSDAGKSRKKPGCFLTTAACDYKGLADDCYELTILREFRDTYLMETTQGRALVEHYYLIAPAISAKLVCAADLDHVWETVQCCINAINSQKFAEATAMYMDMVLALKKQHG